jgi:hypothetical protein
MPRRREARWSPNDFREAVFRLEDERKKED